MALDNLDGVSDSAGGGHRESAFQRGDCVIIPGVNKSSRSGDRMPRRFIVYHIDVVGGTFEYTLLDDKDSGYQKTGVREEQMRWLAM